MSKEFAVEEQVDRLREIVDSLLRREQQPDFSRILKSDARISVDTLKVEIEISPLRGWLIFTRETRTVQYSNQWNALSAPQQRHITEAARIIMNMSSKFRAR